MNKKQKICVWTGIAIAGLLFLWYVTAYRSKNHQIQNTRELFESNLDFLTRMESSRWRSHIVPISREARAFLAEPNALEKPYVLYALLTSGAQPVDEQGHVSCVVTWLERGFECTGIRISFTKDETRETVEVPFPSNIWDEKARKRYKKHCYRSFKFIGVVCEDHILFQLKHRDHAGSLRVYGEIRLPLRIVSDPAFVTVFDRKGNETKPTELFVVDEVRQFILKVARDTQIAPTP
jgi:hypothetical protein